MPLTHASERCPSPQRPAHALVHNERTASLCQRACHAWRENGADSGDAEPEEDRPHRTRMSKSAATKAMVRRTHVLLRGEELEGGKKDTRSFLQLAAAQVRWAAPLQAGVGEAVGGDVGGEAVVREGDEGVELPPGG